MPADAAAEAARKARLRKALAAEFAGGLYEDKKVPPPPPPPPRTWLAAAAALLCPCCPRRGN